MLNSNIYPVYTQVKEEPTTICRELKEEVFEYPFFNQGVSYSNTENFKQYNLEELDTDQRDSDLVIKGIIYHTSHCGSTLLSRMLGKLSKVRIVSEPESINGLLLSAILHQTSAKEVKRKLEQIIRLYCKKHTVEEFLILKLTSWNVFSIDVFQKCFPDTKWLFIDRNTDELLSSLESNNGGFIDWWEYPVDVLRKHFIDPNDKVLSKREYLQKMIAGHRGKARMAKNSDALFLKYPNFIDKYEEILEHFEIVTSEDDVQKSLQILDHDAKALTNHGSGLPYT